jgi:hypothetical protein
MVKRLYASWSILLVLVISVAVLGPGCTGEGECTIEVKATLCGDPYPGAVGYTLIGPGSPIQGTSVPATHTVDCGSWGCGNVSGGPAGAFLANIAPSANQTVSAGSNITFTLEFEENQDAWIDFWIEELLPKPWTVDGIPVDPVYEIYEAIVGQCQVIDVHFQQGVLGCDDYLAAVNETSYLRITDLGNAGPGTQIFVSNNSCALNKTPEPPNKYSQQTTIEGDPANPQDPPHVLGFQGVVTLDVETAWQLLKEVNYTKKINWLGISVGAPEPHPCVLFELVVPPIPGAYNFQLDAWAEVELVDAEDGNTQNDKTDESTLWLTVNVGGP